MLPNDFAVSQERLEPVFDANGHVDEGTVHTWLDGAFDADAADRVARHVDGCESCGAVVAEARGLAAASTRILSGLDIEPAGAVPAIDVARTAARVVAPTARVTGSRTWKLRAAAALFVVVGGSVVLRGRGSARVTSTDSGVSAESVAVAPPSVPIAPAASAAPPVSTAPAPVKVAEAIPAAPPKPQVGDTPTLNVALSTANMAQNQVGMSTDATSPMRRMLGGLVGTAMASRSAPSTASLTRSRPVGEMPPRDVRPLSREQYDRIEDNPFLGVRTNPLSTFSIDVDRTSYTNVRRFLTSGQRPPKDAVRIEEFINYFPYTLPAPRGNDPVSISSDVIAAPWQPRHQLVRVALQAKRIETANLPPNNLVFLIDVSGSMNDWNKLPLVKQALRLLVDQLRPQDRVAIVAYAGAAGLVLPSTSGDEKVRILAALDRLDAGGSTAGGAGIELAYRAAREQFLDKGNNRVILATDGDFNVGPSSDAELERLVEMRRREGTYLTVLGFGTGNYQASKMEKLAKVGNGNAAYVDNLAEARKVLVEEMGATLLTVANDVKLQVEFNPAAVQAYRLIGYENRLLATEDFNDDTKDAGDIGAGHQVTALYEVVPVGVQGTVSIRGRDSLRYITPDRSMQSTVTGNSSELLFVKLRYKQPGQTESRLMSHAVAARVNERPNADTRFAAAVASFGMLLRDSEYKGNSSAAQILEQIRAALGDDVGSYRAEFVQLVERWRSLGIRAGERR